MSAQQEPGGQDVPVTAAPDANGRGRLAPLPPPLPEGWTPAEADHVFKQWLDAPNPALLSTPDLLALYPWLEARRSLHIERMHGLDGNRDYEAELARQEEERLADQAFKMMRASRQGREKLNASEFQPPGWDETPGTLKDSLARPRPEVRYLVSGLLGARHNLSVEGMYKTGKTALIAALAGALADGRPFLGFAGVHPPAGNIGVWNLEMDSDDFDDYLAAEVASPDRIWSAHLRHKPVPFNQAGRKFTVDWLKYGGCQVWIIDTWSRLCAWNGIDPLSNYDVAHLTAVVDEIKAEAGVETLVVTTHMPHSAKTVTENERAFGAQSFSGWVDCMWRYTRDEAGSRFLSADGRKIRLDECQVLQDPAGQLVAQAGDRKEAAKAQLSFLVLNYVQGHPGSTTNDVQAGVGGRSTSVSQALKEAASRGWISSQNGKNNSVRWFRVGPQVGPK